MSALTDYSSIDKVAPGRRASMTGHVSQDMELWVSKEQVDEHWTVIARSGPNVQELAVYGSLDRDELKSAIDTVLQKSKGAQVGIDE